MREEHLIARSNRRTADDRIFSGRHQYGVGRVEREHAVDIARVVGGDDRARRGADGAHGSFLPGRCGRLRSRRQAHGGVDQYAEIVNVNRMSWRDVMRLMGAFLSDHVSRQPTGRGVRGSQREVGLLPY